MVLVAEAKLTVIPSHGATHPHTRGIKDYLVAATKAVAAFSESLTVLTICYFVDSTWVISMEDPVMSEFIKCVIYSQNEIVHQLWMLRVYLELIWWRRRVSELLRWRQMFVIIVTHKMSQIYLRFGFI